MELGSKWGSGVELGRNEGQGNADLTFHFTLMAAGGRQQRAHRSKGVSKIQKPEVSRHVRPNALWELEAGGNPYIVQTVVRGEERTVVYGHSQR